MRSRSSVVAPARLPPSRSACGSQPRSASPVQPILAAIAQISAHSDACSPRCSCTRRTTRSRTSGETHRCLRSVIAIASQVLSFRQTRAVHWRKCTRSIVAIVATTAIPTMTLGRRGSQAPFNRGARLGTDSALRTGSSSTPISARSGRATKCVVDLPGLGGRGTGHDLHVAISLSPILARGCLESIKNDLAWGWRSPWRPGSGWR